MRLCRCGALVVGRCERCDPPQQQRGFYGSNRWRVLSLRKRQANPLCEECERFGRVTAATEVHHLKPVAVYPDLRFEWENLMSVCSECHSKLESAARVKHPPVG